MEKVWRLIIDGAREPEINMALDEAIMLRMAEKESAPTLRIYRWLYPCVSIGRFQSIGEVGNFPIVRRPTGGGSVYHNEDGFTYSLIYREDSGAVARGTAASYLQIHEAVAAALNGLGMEAGLYSPVSKRGKAFGACFASPVESDVICGGRKVAGAAQRRRFGVVLHQGEIGLPLDVWRKSTYNIFLNRFINSLSGRLQARFLEGKISEEEDCLADGLLMDHIEEVTK